MKSKGAAVAVALRRAGAGTPRPPRPKPWLLAGRLRVAWLRLGDNKLVEAEGLMARAGLGGTDSNTVGANRE